MKLRIFLLPAFLTFQFATLQAVDYIFSPGDVEPKIEEIMGVYCFEVMDPQIDKLVKNLDIYTYEVIFASKNKAINKKKIDDRLLFIKSQPLIYVSGKKNFKDFDDLIQRFYNRGGSRGWLVNFDDHTAKVRRKPDLNLTSKCDFFIRSINSDLSVENLEMRAKSFLEDFTALKNQINSVSSTVNSVLEQKRINMDYLNAFEQQKLSPILWIIEDITGNDLTVDSFELVEKKVVSPVDKFKAYRSQNFEIIEAYLNTFNDKLLFNLEGNKLQLPEEVYSYIHIIKYKMFNRIFYSVLDDYKGKIHNMRLIPLE